MNGRIYDPELGRMISADPTIPHPHNPQSYNRYSYVMNNPLPRTDPTGFTDEANQNKQAVYDQIQTLGFMDPNVPTDLAASGLDTLPDFDLINTQMDSSIKTLGLILKIPGVEKDRARSPYKVRLLKQHFPDSGDVIREIFKGGREDNNSFNPQKGDAAVYPAQTNCAIISECVSRLDQYEEILNIDQSLGKDPRVQLVFELMREVGKQSLCSSKNSCDLMQYYNQGLSPPPLWPPEVPNHVTTPDTIITPIILAD